MWTIILDDAIVAMINFLNVIILSLYKSMILFLANNMLTDLGVKSHDTYVLFLRGSEKSVYV